MCAFFNREEEFDDYFQDLFLQMEDRSLHSLMWKYTWKFLIKVLSVSCSLSGLSLEIITQLLSGCHMLWKIFSYIEDMFLHPVCIFSLAYQQLCSVCSSQRLELVHCRDSIVLIFCRVFFPHQIIFIFPCLSQLKLLGLLESHKTHNVDQVCLQLLFFPLIDWPPLF